MPKKAATRKTATSTSKKAAKKAVKKAAPKKVATKKVAAKKAVKKAVTKKGAKKKSAAKTTIVAKMDVGFGNRLYLRGEGSGSGLAWEQGVLMECEGDDTWIWESSSVQGAVNFKVLINDEVWSEGENYAIFPGATIVFEPMFAD